MRKIAGAPSALCVSLNVLAMGEPEALRAVHGLQAPEALARERRETITERSGAADAADQLRVGLMAKRMQFLFRLYLLN